MKVTPLDIRRKEFKRSMRGYADEEVDIFLDEVADEFEHLYQENTEMQDKLQRLEEQLASHAQLKNALEKTLVSAQLQADTITANARKESELIMRDAELKARNIVSESYSETQKVQQTLVHLKHLEEDFRFKFRSLLEGHLKLLGDAPLSVQGADAAVFAAGAVGKSPAAELDAVAPVSGIRAVAAGMAAGEVESTMAPPVAALASTDEVSTGAGAAEANDSVWPSEPASVSAQSSADESDAVGTTWGEPMAFSAFEDEIPTEETEGEDDGREPAAQAGEVQETAVRDAAVEETAIRNAPVRGQDATEGAAGEQAAVGGPGSGAADDATAESEAAPEATLDEDAPPPVRGFYFGRRLEDLDDSFVTSETVEEIKQEKGRDFEW